MADLREHLCDVPEDRIRLYPTPGTATEEESLLVAERGEGLCELVDGVLVEKTMGYIESNLAIELACIIRNFLDQYRIGKLFGSDGPYRLFAGRLRMPDLSFVPWTRFPGRTLPKGRVLAFAPDLAVEILSEGNTKREMQLKLAEYFQAGTRLVWYIDPRDRTATIYTAIDHEEKIDANGILDGRDVLPGFTLRLGDLFARAEGPP
ncbi:MAG: Uma2 family endonuclease [Pirellulales bacterium]